MIVVSIMIVDDLFVEDAAEYLNDLLTKLQKDGAKIRAVQALDWHGMKFLITIERTHDYPIVD